MRVYVIGRSPAYKAMFRRQEGYEVVESPHQADAIQFTGGADVHPSLYCEGIHIRTGSDKSRDTSEAAIFEENVTKKVLLGICRGAQFLNVMNGGKLYQHVDGHAIGGTHPAYSETFKKTFHVTSTHHQMMIPHKTGFVEGYSLGIAERKESVSAHGAILTNTTDRRDVEVVWYEDTKSLCFQPHPELPGAGYTEDYYFSLIEKLILNQGD